MLRKCLLAVSLICGLLWSASAQTGVTVTGTVVDEGAVPMPGVVIVVKNNPSGGHAITDANGNFTINVAKGSTLVASYMGFITEEKKFETAGDWLVTLREDTTQLEEVVVVGYGVQKKESVVGSITQVNASQLANSGTTSVNNALSGKVPGLLSYSANASGAPGENNESLMIRGLSSWNGNAPLVMVDGVEREMSELSPSEIESISVLKDASATAVYGAKGANGVILVTTKTGKKGTPKLHVNAEYSMSNPVMMPEHVDAFTTATMANVAYRNQGSFSSQYSDYALKAFQTGSDPLRYPDTNFYDLLMKNFAPGFNADVSLSGGTDKLRYYLGLGYVHEGSIIKDIHEYGETNWSSDRINWRLNLDFNVTKTTLLSLKAGGNIKDVQGPITRDTNSQVSSKVTFGYMYKASTIAYPAFYPEWALDMYPDPDYPNEYGIRIADNQGYEVSNPYSFFMNAAYVRTEENRINTDLILKQDLDFITKGLSASFKVGISSKYDVVKEQVYHNNPKWDINWNGVDVGLENPWIRSSTSEYVWNLKPYSVGINNTASGNNTIFYLEGAVNYNRKFAKAHNVTGLLLYSQREYNAGANFPKRNQSFVGRATYDYKGRYLLEVNASITGSEQFAPSNRYGFFPSVAVGYNMSKEPWWKKAMPWWSTMKVRYSHGMVGSDNSTANWLYVTYWSKISTSGGGNAITEGAAPNENARWETAVKRDLGFEMGWLDDRLTLNVDFYNEDRKDILASPIVTPFVATSYKDVNSGAIKKHGMEIELRYNHVFANSLAMEVGAIFGISENRITIYEDLPYAKEYQKQTGTQYGAMRTGESLVDDRYFNTVDELHGYPTYASSWSQNVVPGVYKFLDYDRNGLIDQNDLHAVDGSVYAPGLYSLSFGMGYKGFSFNILGTGTIGKYITYNAEAMVPFVLGELSVHTAQTDYWTPTNKDAAAPVPLFSQSMYSWGGGTVSGEVANVANVAGYSLGLEGYTWRRSDYFMLKEARVSYKFDFTKRRKSIFNGLTVSLIGNNLFLISPIKDMNPTATSGTTAVYPQMRTVKLGVSMDF